MPAIVVIRGGRWRERLHGQHLQSIGSAVGAHELGHVVFDEDVIEQAALSIEIFGARWR